MNIIVSKCELTKDGKKYYVGFTFTGDYGVSKYVDTFVDVAAAQNYDDVIRIAYSNLESLITSVIISDNEKMPHTGKSLFDIIPDIEQDLRAKLEQVKKQKTDVGTADAAPTNEKKGKL